MSGIVSLFGWIKGFVMRFVLIVNVLLLAGCLVSPPQLVPRPDEQKQEQTEQITPGKIAVLIVEATEDRAKLPQYAGVFASSRIRDYLTKGGHKWRWVDNEVDPKTLDDFWRAALEQSKGKPLPYIAITNGKQGVSGTLPPSEDEVLALLKKWGGE